MPLHIEHRPSNLSEIFGNKAVVESLTSIFERKSDYPHAYLFHGPTGCGKTTLARIVAKMLKCDKPEEYNMANLRGIDAVRNIAEDCQYYPITGTNRVYILDEIHRQTKDAQNALLKLLEDPPAHVYFVLGTTDPDQLIPTLRGRCHPYQVKALKTQEMMALLKSVLKKEKIEDYPDKILNEITLLSEGLPRNALVMLDAVIDMPDEDTILASLSTIATCDATSKELCNAVLTGVPWEKTREILKALLMENTPEDIKNAILGYCANTLLGSKRHDRASDMIDIFGDNIFYNGRQKIIQMVYLATRGQ
jgi:DNA polymerase-3 subunit gamma/tau